MLPSWGHKVPLGYDVIELEEELRQNRIEAGLEKDKIIARTAKIQQREKDIDTFLREGYNPNEISIVSQIPLAVVKARIAKMERDREEADKGLLFPEGEGGYFAIFT